MKRLIQAAVVASACMFPMVAGATVVDTGAEFWNAPANTNANLGTGSTSFALGTSTVTAQAGTVSGTTVTLGNRNLLLNNRGADEQGLGACNVACSGDGGEIDTNEIVQVSLIAAEAAGYSSFSIQANSATGGELLRVYGTDTSNTLGTLIASLTSADGDVVEAAAQNYKYLNFIITDGSGDNVLVHLIDAQLAAVPEPATLALLGAGLLGFGFLGRRKAK